MWWCEWEMSPLHTCTWALCSTVWGGYRTFRRYRLAEGSASLEAVLVPLHCLYFTSAVEDVSSQLLACCRASPTITDSTPGTASQINSCINYFLVTVFYHSNKSNCYKITGSSSPHSWGPQWSLQTEGLESQKWLFCSLQACKLLMVQPTCRVSLILLTHMLIFTRNTGTDT